MNPYQEQILEHYKNPQHYGKPTWQPTASQKIVNLSCGDEIEVFLLVDDSIIKDYSFVAQGCSISIASASMLGEKLIGKKVKEVKNMSNSSVIKALGIELTITREKCALLGIEAVKKALEGLNVV